ncbi:U1 snRNP protein [Naganishia albida]|nr:U1 snRNP protein [Naganishia albida]
MSDSPSKSAGEWQEYKAPDGRTYWSHTVTKQSRWDKPDDLKTPFERAMAKTQWKQYMSKDRPYYVNTATRETVWELPNELKELKQQVEKDEEETKRRIEAGEQPEGDVKRIEDRPQDNSSALTRHDPSLAAARERSPSPALSSIDSIDDPLADLGPEPVVPAAGFHNDIEAEKAFIYLLKKFRVDETWTWDVTMRKIIVDPLYKSLKTLAEKKNVWQKYTSDLVANAEAARQEKISRLRPHYKKLFQQNKDKIKAYSTFRTAENLFANDRIWNALERVEDRKTLFDEYVHDLRTAKQNAETALRQRNLAVMKSLIKQLPITVSTRWRDARNMIIESTQFKADKSLQNIEDIDILEIYDDYSTSLIREHGENMRKAQSEKARRARKARDGFRELLAQMEASGQLTSRTKWKEFLPLIQDKEAYDHLLGMPGSSPLDLFRDVVDDIGEAVAEAIRRVMAASEESNQKIELGMTREEFEKFLEEHKLTSVIDAKHVQEVYEVLISRLERDAADKKRRAERRRRHLIDDLRYAMKKAEPPVDLDGTYEDAISTMEQFREFKDLDEEGRKEAFEKFVRRQKEKLRERVRDKERERERDAGNSDADGSASGHRSKSHRRSASPTGSDRRSGDKRIRHDKDRSNRDRDGDYRSRDKERSVKDKRSREDRYDDDRDDEDRYRRSSKDEYRSRRKGEADDEPLNDGHVTKKPRLEDEQAGKSLEVTSSGGANGVGEAEKNEEGEIEMSI